MPRREGPVAAVVPARWRKLGLLIVLSLAFVPRALFAAETTSGMDPGHGVSLLKQPPLADTPAALQQRLQANPKDLEVLVALGRIAFEESRVEDAVDYFERAAAVAPQNSSIYFWLGRTYGLHARILGAPRGIGPARRTKKSLEKAVQLDPDNLDARYDLATFYREAPMIVGGSRRAALAQIEEIQRRDPYLGELARGDYDLANKHLAEAEHHFRAAIEIDPKKADAYLRLGMLCQRAERYEEAFTYLRKTLHVDPSEKRAYFQIGKTADLSGQRLDEGERALREYLQCRPFFVMPSLASAHTRLGNIYLKQGRSAEARVEYQAALKLAPDDKEAAAGLKRVDTFSASAREH